VESLDDFLRRRSRDNVVCLSTLRGGARIFALPFAAIEERALHLGLLPLRHLRNGLGCEAQLALLRSRVAVVGCGGLGGTIATLLARLGTGFLRLIDPDVFEEHNLNRQQFATVDTLGQRKVQAAREALASINPATAVDAVCGRWRREHLEDVAVVVDGLDSAAERRELGRTCRMLGLPLVHGAVRQWYGQAALVSDGSDPFALLYPETTHPDSRPPEVIAPTVAMVAAIQAAETAKLLLGLPSPLAGCWLSCNLHDDDFDLIAL
jgi:molybdopterin/thiamine biosynthesis adenylyltransferase